MAASVLVWTGIGALLAGLAVPVLVFVLDFPGLNLQTGIRFVDSMLYSIGGPLAIFILAGIWAIGGAVAGAVLGYLLGLVARVSGASREG